MTRPKLIGWHSFKGGSGRSLALSNVAVDLAMRGKRIVCVDMDIESCGLGTLFDVDLDGKATTTDILVERNYQTVRKSIVSVSQVRGWKCVLNLIGSGHESPVRLSAIQWSPETVRVFADLVVNKYAQAEQMDYVFVDCRSGMSEQLALSLLLSPDGVIVFTRPDRQSRLGTEHLVRTIRSIGDDARLPGALTPLVVVNGVPASPDAEDALVDLGFRLDRAGFQDRRLIRIPFDQDLLLLEGVGAPTATPTTPVQRSYREIAEWIEAL